jgi:ribonucleoside-triphosphate reductase
MTAKYGIPYFQNFINSDISPEDIRSMCCRLKLNKIAIDTHVKKKTGGLFGAGDLTGSIGVVTINLPKLAFLSNKENYPASPAAIHSFRLLLKKYIHLAKDSLEIKRKMLNKNLELGMFPWTKRYLRNGFDGHFSTIGLVGGHECCMNLLGVGIDTQKGHDFMLETLKFMLEEVESIQEETGNLYNLEATPAEGTAYRLAKIDKKMHEGIFQSGCCEPYYTNSTQLPVGTSDVLFAIKHQDELQQVYTGGTVFHTFLGESVANEKAIKDFLLKVFTNTRMPFVSITPTFRRKSLIAFSLATDSPRNVWNTVPPV